MAIHENYLKGICGSCNNDICKIYGGICKKKERHNLFIKLKNILRRAK